MRTRNLATSIDGRWFNKRGCKEKREQTAQDHEAMDRMASESPAYRGGRDDSEVHLDNKRSFYLMIGVCGGVMGIASYLLLKRALT